MFFLPTAMLVTNLFLDDNEQIADILIADGFDPGTIFQPYLNLRTTNFGNQFPRSTSILVVEKSKKVEMEMVIEGSPNMFLHQTFENIV